MGLHSHHGSLHRALCRWKRMCHSVALECMAKTELHRVSNANHGYLCLNNDDSCSLALTLLDWCHIVANGSKLFGLLWNSTPRMDMGLHHWKCFQELSSCILWYEIVMYGVLCMFWILIYKMGKRNGSLEANGLCLLAAHMIMQQMLVVCWISQKSQSACSFILLMMISSLWLRMIER